jgi:hypothetical protein
MPILGNLSEFPLPEILLLIGSRTGRLRLLDVPEFGIMDIDFSSGEVQALHLGGVTLTESGDLLAKLSAVVQAQGGMFEFRLHPVASVTRQQPLFINQLVMSLVCYVDEQLARQRTVAPAGHQYVLEYPLPEIWIEPELNAFFIAAYPYLVDGTGLDDLAKRLNMDVSGIHTHLTNLRLLGLVRLIDKADTAQIAGLEVQEKISRKSNEFLRASRVANEIQRISKGLPRIDGLAKSCDKKG